MLPLIVLLSAFVGSVVGVMLKRLGGSKPFAFWIYIAIAGMIALCMGNQ